MSIAISPEAEAKARQIPEFAARLERFIDDQFALEQWRTRQSKLEIDAIVEEGIQRGQSLRSTNVDRQTLFSRLNELSERLSHGG